MLLSAFDAILSDLDGVVYEGPNAIAGAPEALNRAQEQGVQVAFVTNNASRSVDTVSDHLISLGVNTAPEFVVSSAQAASRLLAERLEPGSRVLICGAQALADCVEAEGLTPVWKQADEPVAVVQGFNPKMTWEDMAEAAFTLSDPEILYIASNTDMTIPKERGIAPGNGTLVSAVASATKRTPLVAGKPEAAIFITGAQKLGSKAPLVVGDRLDTDIQGGNRAKMATLCVMTGVQVYEDILAAITLERPTFLVENLGQMFENYPASVITEDGEAFVADVNGWTARAEGTSLKVTGAGETIDGWRAACAAWWALNPELEQPLAPEVFEHDF